MTARDNTVHDNTGHDNEAAVIVDGLTAGYNGVPAVHGLSMTARFGAVTALLGANGAGKTTTLLAIVGRLRPMAGTITLNGTAVGKLPCHERVRMGLGMVPDDRGLAFELTVRENLRLHARRRDREHAAKVLDLFPPLRPLLNRQAGLLSGGEQQMLSLACAMSTSPRVLLIDEMSHGLAPVIVEQLLPVVRNLAREGGAAVILVEQNVESALRVADDVYILRRGRGIAAGSAAEIRQRDDILQASYLGGGTAAEPPVNDAPRDDRSQSPTAIQ